MYVLVRLENRAETTDTLIYYVSELRSSLEEILLSLYEELIFMNIPKETIDKYINSFQIIQVPFLEN